jgi:hypothetical protein
MATFTETFSRMRQDFDDAQAARDQLFRATREHVGNLAHGVQQQLAGFRSDMRQLRGQLTEMADGVRSNLRELHGDLNTGGDIFRKESKPRKRR